MGNRCKSVVLFVDHKVEFSILIHLSDEKNTVFVFDLFTLYQCFVRME